MLVLFCYWCELPFDWGLHCGLICLVCFDVVFCEVFVLFYCFDEFILCYLVYCLLLFILWFLFMVVVCIGVVAVDYCCVGLQCLYFGYLGFVVLILVGGLFASSFVTTL